MDIDTTTTDDPNIAANVNNQLGQSNAQVAGGYEAGNGEARGLLNRPTGTNANLNYGDQATSRAIQSRYTNQYNQASNALNTQTLKNADADHIRNLQTATNAASTEVELNRQKQLLAWKIDQANKRARGNTLGNVLGIVGTVAGAVVGGYVSGGTGAAAGAAAGGKLGEGIGQAAGGQ